MTEAERLAETVDRSAFERGEVTFIGTATVLVRYERDATDRFDATVRC
jgi:hypothetical protein